MITVLVTIIDIVDTTIDYLILSLLITLTTDTITDYTIDYCCLLAINIITVHILLFITVGY